MFHHRRSWLESRIDGGLMWERGTAGRSTARAAAAVCLSWCAWAAPTAAGAQSVTASPSTGAAAYDAAFQALLTSPGDPALMSRFAEEAMRVGAYDAALTTFERFAIVYPKDPFVRLHLGAVYLRLGDYQSAVLHLDYALADPRLAGERRSEAERLKARAQSRLDGIEISGFLQLGAAYEHKPAAAAGPGSVFSPASGGRVADDDDFRAFGQAGLDAAIALDTPTDDKLRASFRLAGSRQLDATQIDDAAASADIGLDFALFATSIDQLYGGPFVTVAGYSDDDEAFFAAGGGVRGRYEPNENVVWRFEAGYRRYEGTLDLYTADDFSGRVSRLARLHEDLSLLFSLGGQRRVGDDGVNSFTTVSGGAALIHRFEDPLGGALPWRTRYALDVAYTEREAVEGSFEPVLPIGIVAGPTDVFLFPADGDATLTTGTFRVRQTAPITSTVDLFVEGVGRQRWSSDDPLTFESYGASVGVTLKY